MFVLWTRAKTPTGVIAALASPATDALGRAGFDGDIDTHFWERFGSALLLSIVSDASSIGRQQLQDSSIQINNTTGATNTAAGIAVEQSINIPPTLNKNQGELVNIFVARDVDFSSVYQLQRIETRTQIFSTAPSPGVIGGAGRGDEMSAGRIDRTRWRPALVLARYLEPLAPYLADDTLTEIVVNRPGEIFVEGPGGWTRHEAASTHARLPLASRDCGCRPHASGYRSGTSGGLDQLDRRGALPDRGAAGGPGRHDQSDDPQAIGRRP